MRVVDDYESLLNELDLILERAHDSFSNVIDVRIISVPHVFVCKKINLLFQIRSFSVYPVNFLKVSGDRFSKNIDLISSHTLTV